MAGAEETPEAASGGKAEEGNLCTCGECGHGWRQKPSPSKKLTCPSCGATWYPDLGIVVRRNGSRRRI